MVLKKPEYESIYYAHKVYKMKKENEDLSFYELGLELEMKDELEKENLLQHLITILRGRTLEKN